MENKTADKWRTGGAQVALHGSFRRFSASFPTLIVYRLGAELSRSLGFRNYSNTNVSRTLIDKKKTPEIPRGVCYY